MPRNWGLAKRPEDEPSGLLYPRFLVACALAWACLFLAFQIGWRMF